jgi:hypothetical protein
MSVLGGPAGDRPDTKFWRDLKFRRDINPSAPPRGYYEPGSAPLRNQVRRALASMLGNVKKPMRRWAEK